MDYHDLSSFQYLISGITIVSIYNRNIFHEFMTHANAYHFVTAEGMCSIPTFSLDHVTILIANNLN